MKRAGFELRVLPRKGEEYGVALYELMGNGAEPRPVVRVWGTPFRATIDRCLAAVKKAGARASDLQPTRTAPFRLDEETGVRLGLLYLATKPMRKTSRIDAISHGTAAMGAEEAYYWYARCSDTETGRRARRAFRILHADE